MGLECFVVPADLLTAMIALMPDIIAAAKTVPTEENIERASMHSLSILHITCVSCILDATMPVVMSPSTLFAAGSLLSA